MSENGKIRIVMVELEATPGIVQHEIDHLNGICKVGDDRFPDEIDLRARREKLLRGAVEEGHR